MSTILLTRKLFSVNSTKNVANFSGGMPNAKSTTRTTSFLVALLKAFSTPSA